LVIYCIDVDNQICWRDVCMMFVVIYVRTYVENIPISETSTSIKVGRKAGVITSCCVCMRLLSVFL